MRECARSKFIRQGQHGPIVEPNPCIPPESTSTPVYVWHSVRYTTKQDDLENGSSVLSRTLLELLSIRRGAPGVRH